MKRFTTWCPTWGNELLEPATQQASIMSSEAKERLERLQAICGAHRGVVTNNVNKVNNILPEESTYATSEQIQQLEIIHGLLQAKLKALKDIHQKILSLCELQDIEHEIEESERVVEKVIKRQKEMNDVTQKPTGTAQINTQENPLVAIPGFGHGNSMSSSSQAKTKLPKFTLPKFRGDVTSWTFWESVPVRILFDNGSQQSYVTDNLKSKFGLKPLSSETLHKHFWRKLLQKGEVSSCNLAPTKQRE